MDLGRVAGCDLFGAHAVPPVLPSVPMTRPTSRTVRRSASSRNGRARASSSRPGARGALAVRSSRSRSTSCDQRCFGVEPELRAQARSAARAATGARDLSCPDRRTRPGEAADVLEARARRARGSSGMAGPSLRPLSDEVEEERHAREHERAARPGPRQQHEDVRRGMDAVVVLVECDGAVERRIAGAASASANRPLSASPRVAVRNGATDPTTMSVPVPSRREGDDGASRVGHEGHARPRRTRRVTPRSTRDRVRRRIANSIPPTAYWPGRRARR